MLCKDLIKYTHAKIVDYRYLNRAVLFLESRMSEINKSIKQGEIEQARQILELEKTIDGDFEVRKFKENS